MFGQALKGCKDRKISDNRSHEEFIAERQKGAGQIL